MKNIIKITLLVVVAILVSCRVNKLVSCENANNEIIKEQTNDIVEITKEEEQAMDRVIALPELQNIGKVYLFSKGICDDIDSNTYYYIQVMEDMETHYHTVYHFFIPEKPDAEIKILDVVEDTIISLEQWRKINKL